MATLLKWYNDHIEICEFKPLGEQTVQRWGGAEARRVEQNTNKRVVAHLPSLTRWRPVHAHCQR